VLNISFWAALATCVTMIQAAFGGLRTGAAADAENLAAAVNSISADELKEHVSILADDSFEGREAGSRGGRAAGVYLGKEFQKLALKGASEEKGYYQAFNGNCRNILGWIEGSDPVLKSQYIVVGAHYDHVGLGNRRNSHGPIGYIHNGADDNASGSSGVLEVAKAFTKLNAPPKRSVLFALWDSEEEGLYGSKYWLDHPTVPLTQVKFMFNADMIGRLRKESAEILGSRSAFGLRRFVSEENRGEKLNLDFTWELKENSDHYPFVAHNIPVLMVFTGLHEDYHTPRDKAEKINAAGMQEVARLYFAMALEMADRTQTPTFRPTGRSETPEQRTQREAGLEQAPGRLGISWTPEAITAGLNISAVVSGSAAEQGGIKVGDRLLKFAGREVTDTELLRHWVVAAPASVQVVVQRGTEREPRTLVIKLAGEPMRWGLTWRTDDAEPGCVILTRVTSASPAEAAGLKLNDRIYQVDGQDFADANAFNKAINAGGNTVELEYERRGRIGTCKLHAVDLTAADAKPHD
jgi:C-terminal processing protease CtpA/Prc